MVSSNPGEPFHIYLASSGYIIEIDPESSDVTTYVVDSAKRKVRVVRDTPQMFLMLQANCAEGELEGLMNAAIDRKPITKKAGGALIIVKERDINFSETLRRDLNYN